MPWLALDGDVSASTARFADDDPAGAFVPGSVARVASVGATVQGLGRWSGGLRIRHIGARPLIEDGSVRSRPFTLADLRVGIKVAERVDVLLDVFNLTGRDANDIEYFYRSRLAGEPAAGIDGLHVHPAEPRTVRLSLRIGF